MGNSRWEAESRGQRDPEEEKETYSQLRIVNKRFLPL